MARTSPEVTPKPSGLRKLFRKKDGDAAGPAPTPIESVVDAESGVGNDRELYELLRREIARSRRYGDRSTLVVFDIRVVGYRPTPEAPLPPSPARFVAETLLECIREADFVTRLDMTHFVVLLTECDREGARMFAERARTRIASTPYARDGESGHIYARAWAGFASWDPSITRPEEYLSAAMTEFERTRPQYEMAQLWFSGNIG
jgi:GGDEF domain-containing protein